MRATRIKKINNDKKRPTENNNRILDYLQKTPDENRRKDCSNLVQRMSRLTGLPTKCGALEL